MKFPPRKHPQNRHCEEGRRPDAAIQSPALPSLDCFAPLAMTAWVNALHHNGARAFMNLGQHSPLEKMLVDQPTLTFGPLRLKKPANELLVGLAHPSSSRAKPRDLDSSATVGMTSQRKNTRNELMGLVNSNTFPSAPPLSPRASCVFHAIRARAKKPPLMQERF